MECRPESSCTNRYVVTNRETRALNRAMAAFTQWRSIDLYLTAQLETARALCCYFGPWLIHYALCQPWPVGWMNTNKGACGGSNRHSHTNRWESSFFSSASTYLSHLCVENHKCREDRWSTCNSSHPPTRIRSTVHFHFRLTHAGAPPRPIISRTICHHMGPATRAGRE